MNKIIKYLTKRKMLVAFSVLLLFYVVYFGLIKELSFKINGDFFAILSTVSACKNYIIGNFDINVFPDALIYSPHTNIISWIVAIISIIFHLKPIQVFYILGPLSIIMFLFSFDYFLGQLNIPANRRALIIISSILLVPTAMSFNYLGDGIFTLSDIVITAFGWRLIGFVLFFACMGLAIDIERNPSNQKYILLILVSLLLINIYLLNYLILIAILFTYFLFKTVKERKLNRAIFGILIFTIVGGLTNIVIWPLYDLSDLLTQSYQDFQISPLIQDPQSYSVNSFPYYINTLSISIFGLVYLIREKNELVKATAWLCLFIILYSLLVPYIKIPLFWRFVIPLKIFLIITIIKNIHIRINSSTTALVISLFITLYFSYTYQKLIMIKNRPDSQLALYNQVKSLDISDGLILSDERTSNTIQAIPGYKVYAIPGGHVANRMIAKINLEKIDNLTKTLKTYDHKAIKSFLNTNNISYLVINNKASFVETYKLINANNFSFYPKIIQNTDLTVLDTRTNDSKIR